MRHLPLLLALGGCSPSAPPPAPADAVPAGAVAVCAGRPVLAEQVAAVASARRVSPRQALDMLAFDARAAEAAERQGLARLPGVGQVARAEQARALLLRLRQRTAGPPSPQEIAELRRERWLEFDRPEGARVIHAVAMGKENDAARKLASAIHAAVAGAHDPETFERQANSVERGSIEVRVERLPPVARDGHLLEGGGSLDGLFVAAAHDLKKTGDLSPVVATPFGYHVLFLIERLPESRLADAEIAAVAADEISARRAHAELRGLLSGLRGQHPVLVSRSSDDLLSTLYPQQARP